LTAIFIMDNCEFCQLATREDPPPFEENEFAYAIPDTTPLSEGHTLVISRKHASNIFLLPEEDFMGVWDLVRKVKMKLDETERPDGYTVGVNLDTAGGQVVMHAHVHIMPRMLGDVQHARGGVRRLLMNTPKSASTPPPPKPWYKVW